MHLRGKNNIAKRALIHAAAFNLSLILRQMLRVGTARQAADLFAALYFAFLRLTQAAIERKICRGTRDPHHLRQFGTYERYSCVVRPFRSPDSLADPHPIGKNPPARQECEPP